MLPKEFLSCGNHSCEDMEVKLSGAGFSQNSDSGSKVK